MIHQYKVELQERIKNEERENNYFSRKNARENNKNLIENNIRINKNKKYCNNHQIIQVMLVHCLKRTLVPMANPERPPKRNSKLWLSKHHHIAA